MGSVADSAITHYVKTGDVRKMAACPAARRLAAFLHKHELKLVDAHVLIFEANLGLATEIDVLCHGHSGLIVIENKTTLQTRAEHEYTYRMPDRDRPKLLRSLSSLRNSEYVHHQLQLALMLIMMKNTYNIRATGHILVASSDGLNHYPMNPEILNLMAIAVSSLRHFQPACLLKCTYPSVRYVYRPYVRGDSDAQSSSDSITPLPITSFLKKYPDAVITSHYNTGTLSFYERPDVSASLHVDVCAETETTLFLFNVKTTDLTKLDCDNDNERPSLPSNHKHTFANQCFLEMALAARALSTEKKIELRILFVVAESKPFLRKIPATFQSRIK